jgi:Tol biopolymer transport system component
MSLKRLATALMSLAMVVATLAPAGAQPTSSERASESSEDQQGNNESFDPAISNDGRFVAFTSLASNLVPDDTNNDYDVFLYDRQEDTTTRVSESTSGAQANGPSGDPAISGNGRFIAFETEATNLSVKLDRNGYQDIYVHDRFNGTTNRVTINNDGRQADGFSHDPSISDDGRYVAFASGAENLSVKADRNDDFDVFVYDRRTRKTNRVSVNSAKKEGNRDSYEPAISATGRYVAFTSEATNMDDNDRNSAPDVFVYDRNNQKTERVSVASSGQQANGTSWAPAISSSGRVVSFVSNATNLVPDDTNSQLDAFVHDRGNGRTTVVSVSSSGEMGNGGLVRDEPVEISPNGTLVIFVSEATNLVSGDVNNYPDAFVHDRRTEVTTRVGRQTGYADVTNGFAAFDSSAPDEGMADTNNVRDVFVRPLS